MGWSGRSTPRTSGSRSPAGRQRCSPPCGPTWCASRWPTRILLEGIASGTERLDLHHVVPIGERIREPQPRWAVPIICHTSPTIRRRLAAGVAADVNDRWARGRGVDDHQGGATSSNEVAGYLAGDLAALTGAAGRARLEEQLALHGRVLRVAPTGCTAPVADAIGRLDLELATQHGWSLPISWTSSPACRRRRSARPRPSERSSTWWRRPAAWPRWTGEPFATWPSHAPPSLGRAGGLPGPVGQRTVRYEVAYPTIVERPEWLLRC